MSRSLVRALPCAVLLAALAAPARGAEVPAELVSGRCRPVTACRAPCCCRDVGPVRRFLRRIFCPRCCAPAAVVVAPAAPVWVPPPPVIVPSAPLPPAAPPPPAELGRPVVPGAGSSRRLTPPAAPPVRLDRIASAGGVRAQVVSRGGPVAGAAVTVVNAELPTLHYRVAADANGRFGVTLSAGAWDVFARDAAGREVFVGRVHVR